MRSPRKDGHRDFALCRVLELPECRGVPNSFIFDQPLQSEYRIVRIKFLERLVASWQSALGVRTALDIGCGVGYFSATLKDLGLQVTAADGRAENVAEARRRHPGVDFRIADAEDESLSSLGSFDFVLCFGLLYHLENPLRAMRNLRAVTSKVLLIESMCIPEERPFFVLMDEGEVEDQSLRAVSCYPTEGAIIKMSYRAGFPHVYGFREFPDHEEFRDVAGRTRKRTMIAASPAPLESPLLYPVPEPKLSGDLWTTERTGISGVLRRFRLNWKDSRNRKGS
jgi:SAM-dependent methyltransferase